MRKRKSSYRGPNMFGSTEELAIRKAKYELRKQGWSFAKTARQRAVTVAKYDWRVKNLYKQKDDYNHWNPSTDPAEVDHIKPITQGGEHIFENLRVIRRSENQRDGANRSDELIETLLKLNLIYKGDWL